MFRYSRSQIVLKGNNTIILDAYNANPTSMEAALKNFETIGSENKIVFIGEMAELGDESEKEHRHIAELLKQIHCDKIVLVGEKFAGYKSILNYQHFENSQKASEWLKQNPLKNSYILIKGSRSTKMEKIMEAL